MNSSVLIAAALSAMFAVIGASALAQSSVTSLAEYKKKQDDGIAASVKASQARAKSGRLAMMDVGSKTGKGMKGLSSRPTVIKLANPPRQVGVDNRRGIVVR